MESLKIKEKIYNNNNVIMTYIENSDIKVYESN
jgi:hypothetical protein